MKKLNDIISGSKEAFDELETKHQYYIGDQTL